MNTISKFFNATGLNLLQFAQAGLILLVGTLILGLLARFVFGKKSLLNHAVCSAIAIIFIYGITVVIQSCGASLEQFVAPLPFIEIHEGTLSLIALQQLHYTQLFSQLLSMIILSFLVNLAEGWFSKGEKFFGWLLFRILTVIIGYGLHLVVTWLFNRFLPEGIAMYAPVVLLGVLVLLMATGALKIVIGALLSTVNPIIGGLYTFFFANMIGKKLTTAVLTTGILTGLVFLLRYAGITAITVAAGALVAYIPFLIILVILWYLVNKIL